jgi:DNA mismatch repair protein MutS
MTSTSAGKKEETARETGSSPVIAQYLLIKSESQDALLFFRMGDFFELFFRDAEIASEILGIVLTKRGKYQGRDIPMCGVPAHNAEKYLHKLINAGFKVALCEQTESPEEARKKGSKAVVHREIVRVITPGTLTEDDFLEAKTNNYLAACFSDSLSMAIAWADISTGDFKVVYTGFKQGLAILSRIEPKEILLCTGSESDQNAYGDIQQFCQENTISQTFVPKRTFSAEHSERRMREVYGVIDTNVFASFLPEELSVVGAVIDYIELTQKGRLALLKPPMRDNLTRYVQFDTASWSNLEIFHTASGQKKGSLFSVIDHTASNAGARLLAHWLGTPLVDSKEIAGRQDNIAFFMENFELAKRIRAALKQAPDSERALSRIIVGRASPRDLFFLRETLQCAADIWQYIFDIKQKCGEVPVAVLSVVEQLQGYSDIIQEYYSALVASPTGSVRDGGFVAAKYNPALDELHMLCQRSRQIIANLQAKYQRITGVGSLKIKHNNIIGHFIEVTEMHASKVSENKNTEIIFVHRQSLKGSVRFSTQELAETEAKIARASGQALEIECQIYEKLCQMAIERCHAIQNTFAALAEIDVWVSFSLLAENKKWVRPVVDESRVFDIKGGYHPVVAEAIKKNHDHSTFVTNDCTLDADENDSGASAIWIITGPNMAGKSTFLRQNAIIAILAQIGSCVPAAAARIGVVKQIFSRVGASDDLARGRSTFMVEMVETATILNQAGPDALVILDEIGRGTATFDGLSIAWAVVEYLHNISRCRAMFATHYHEMTKLSKGLSSIANMTIAVQEWEGEIILLHKIIQGEAKKSYGLQVARFAGIPSSVISRAQQILEILEQENKPFMTDELERQIRDTPLFSQHLARVDDSKRASDSKAMISVQPSVSELDSPLHDFVEKISPDTMSPREALEVLYEIKKLCR